MKTVEAGVSGIWNAEAVRAAQGVELWIGGVAYRWTNWMREDVVATIDAVAQTFTRRGFQVGDTVVTGDGQQASEVSLSDENRAIRSLAVVTDFDGRARLWDFYFDLVTFAYVGKYLRIDGQMDGMDEQLEGDTESCVIPIIPPTKDFLDEGPRGEFQLNCRFRFKDAQCGYAGGGTECAKTWVACGTFTNQNRFGGFRLAPHLGFAIRWGRDKIVLRGRKFGGEGGHH